MNPRDWIFEHGERLKELCHQAGIKTSATKAYQDPYSPLFIADLNWGRTLVLGIRTYIPKPMVDEWAWHGDRILVVNKDAHGFTAEDLLELKHIGTELPPAEPHMSPCYSTSQLKPRMFKSYFPFRWDKL